MRPRQAASSCWLSCSLGRGALAWLPAVPENSAGQVPRHLHGNRTSPTGHGRLLPLVARRSRSSSAGRIGLRHAGRAIDRPRCQEPSGV